MTPQDLFRQEFDVSRETIDRLDTYATLLQKWNPSINLVAKSTVDDVWGRHFRDSAQLFVLRGPECRTWLDLGAGGGFPGLVIAILAADISMSVTLVESDARKVAFLRTVTREVGLRAIVMLARAECLPPQNADVISARALAPLTVLLALAQRHLSPGGFAVFPKGANADREIAEALALWRFQVHKFPSVTDPAGTVLRIGEIDRA